MEPFGPTFKAILEWNLTEAAHKIPASASIPIPPDDQGYSDTDYSINPVKPSFVEVYPFQLTDKAKRLLGRPVIFGEDAAQAMQIAAIFAWSIIANEEITDETD